MKLAAKRGRKESKASKKLAKMCVVEGCWHYSNSDGRAADWSKCTTCDALFHKDQNDKLKNKAEIC
jgi:hypothetical protein